MTGGHIHQAPATGSRGESERRVAARLFLALFVPLALTLLLPFACWDATNVFCLDSGPVVFKNTSHEDVRVTPFYQDGSTARSIVVHGVQRGRFTVPANSARTIELETGDFDLAGIVVLFPDNDARLVPPAITYGSGNPPVLTIGPRATYPPAGKELARVAGVLELAAPRLGGVFAFVIIPALVVAAAIASVLRWQQRRHVKAHKSR